MRQHAVSRAAKPKAPAALVAWGRISHRLRRALRGLSDADLARRGGDEGWSAREIAHHIVEANLIASTMLIAALARDGGNFDWTWVWPNREWLRRVGYDRVELAPALATLRALCGYLSALIATQPDALTRSVRLNDKPGGKRYAMSVEQILWQEVRHAETHLAEIRALVNHD